MAARKSSGSLLPWLAIAFVVIVLDQATKALIDSSLWMKPLPSRKSSAR